MIEKMKEITKHAGGTLNVVAGCAAILSGVCIGLSMLLYGKKLLKNKNSEE